MPFFETDHLAENNNAIAVRTVPESELRSARGITWARFVTIEPAVDVTAVAAEKVRGFHVLHLSPARGLTFTSECWAQIALRKPDTRYAQSRCAALRCPVLQGLPPPPC
jgi:hypothetical protein